MPARVNCSLRTPFRARAYHSSGEPRKTLLPESRKKVWRDIVDAILSPAFAGVQKNGAAGTNFSGLARGSGRRPAGADRNGRRRRATPWPIAAPVGRCASGPVSAPMICWKRVGRDPAVRNAAAPTGWSGRGGLCAAARAAGSACLKSAACAVRCVPAATTCSGPAAPANRVNPSGGALCHKRSRASGRNRAFCPGYMIFSTEALPIAPAAGIQKRPGQKAPGRIYHG